MNRNTFEPNKKALERMLTALDPAEKQPKQYLFVPHADKQEAIQSLIGLSWNNPAYRSSEKARVLAVVHMDTALAITKPAFGRKGVVSAALDDRLGAYVILWELGHLPFDVLLTTGEEVGRSSAQFFDPKEHQYNWVFSFDRRGTGAVLYQYDTNEMRARLASAGVQVQVGSFSDIAYLDHLGVSGVNFGVGYVGEHAHTCHAMFSDIGTCLQNFLRFWALYSEERMNYVPKPRHTYRYQYPYSKYQNGSSGSNTWSYLTGRYSDIDEQWRTNGYRTGDDAAYTWDKKTDTLVRVAGYRDASTKYQVKDLDTYRTYGNPAAHPSVAAIYFGKCDYCMSEETVYFDEYTELCASCFRWVNK